ncbi:MAG TPA: hypothetical protein PLP82_10495 [Deltaproteobacteria bacterium]|nr:hypothetical protein [Deltaproteobacteria bacterium]HOA44886.1 hypothetical protein [Deltaproteobacteria bacterium]HOC76518.1 hypothetical protein [Deltaproteobacteria bacterium]HOG85098.1 hypothetical protein [Deltaproteobacteria bacterium]HON95100.1 hypothetical protein [Deltaproteobacteria bacterium]
MKRRFTTIGALLLLFLVTSCASAPDQGVHMSHKGDVDAGVYTKGADTFGPGDVPTVVVTGCGERNVTIELIDAASGTIVQTRRDYVPRNWTRWWFFPGLPPGSYQVVLRIAGTVSGSASFTVTE